MPNLNKSFRFFQGTDSYKACRIIFTYFSSQWTNGFIWECSRWSTFGRCPFTTGTSGCPTFWSRTSTGLPITRITTFSTISIMDNFSRCGIASVEVLRNQAHFRRILHWESWPNIIIEQLLRKILKFLGNKNRTLFRPINKLLFWR